MSESLARGYVSHSWAILFAFAVLTVLGAISHTPQIAAGAGILHESEKPGAAEEPFVGVLPKFGGKAVIGAQTLAGFPGTRVRPQHVIENWLGSPEAYLLEARIVLRSFEVDWSSGAMKISGRLWSDFEVEAGHGPRAGQLSGLEVNVALHQLASETDDKVGAVVPGQTATCPITATEEAGDIKLGAAEFSLPPMAKPLPPGFYRLVCKLVFEQQSDSVKNALMWVRDMYGVTAENTPVFGSKRHKEAWKDLIENEMCASQGTLFLGQSPKEVLCRDASYEVYKTLADLASQREELEKQYEIDKKNPGLNPKKVKASFEQSINLLNTLVTRAGGKLVSAEAAAYRDTLAAMNNRREDITRFEDDLKLKYWIALDTLFYDFNSINKAGCNCATAIEKGDNAADQVARVQALAALKKDPAALKERNAKRELAFKPTPAPIKDAAYEYYRRSEETTDFDSASYTTKSGKFVKPDVAKWSTFRVKFLAEFRKRSDTALATIDVSATYSMQKWPDIYKQVVEVRDAIITHTYCYERYLRLQALTKEGANQAALKAEETQCEADWKNEAGDQLKQLEPYFSGAKAPPAAVYGRWESATKRAKHLLKLSDFVYRYSLRIK